MQDPARPHHDRTLQETLWEDEFKKRNIQKPAPVQEAENFRTPVVGAPRSVKPIPYWQIEPEASQQFKPVKFGGELEVSATAEFRVIHSTIARCSAGHLTGDCCTGGEADCGLAARWRWNDAKRSEIMFVNVSKIAISTSDGHRRKVRASVPGPKVERAEIEIAEWAEVNWR